MLIDVVFKTRDVSENKHVKVVQGILNRHSVIWFGQFRSASLYAIVPKQDDVPLAVIEELRALDAPDNSVIVRIRASQEGSPPNYLRHTR